GALAVVWIIALYAAVFGILLIGLSLRLRKAFAHVPA
ncbi:MAG: HdeD family acid-resistance protein, partial [Candidatus Eremiobacteraeota bacterium]|nr:HdeD family acid-resistance protein [Candidatus Eremiobacteraeota bacterium]